MSHLALQRSRAARPSIRSALQTDATHRRHVRPRRLAAAVCPRSAGSGEGPSSKPTSPPPRPGLPVTEAHPTCVSCHAQAPVLQSPEPSVPVTLGAAAVHGARLCGPGPGGGFPGLWAGAPLGRPTPPMASPSLSRLEPASCQALWALQVSSGNSPCRAAGRVGDSPCGVVGGVSVRLTAACPGRGHPGRLAPFDTGPGRAAGAGRASAPRPAVRLAMPISCLGLRVASERQAQWRQRRVWASGRRRPRCSTPQAAAASPAQRAVLGEMPERGLLPGHVHTCIPGWSTVPVPVSTGCSRAPRGASAGATGRREPRDSRQIRHLRCGFSRSESSVAACAASCLAPRSQRDSAGRAPLPGPRVETRGGQTRACEIQTSMAAGDPGIKAQLMKRTHNYLVYSGYK